MFGIVTLNPPDQGEFEPGVVKPGIPASLAIPMNPIDALVPLAPSGVSTTGDPAMEQVVVALTKQFVEEPAAMPVNWKIRSGWDSN
jgi:hypothetical protein